MIYLRVKKSFVSYLKNKIAFSDTFNKNSAKLYVEYFKFAKILSEIAGEGLLLKIEMFTRFTKKILQVAKRLFV